MADPIPSSDQADDPLALFEPEPGSVPKTTGFARKGSSPRLPSPEAPAAAPIASPVQMSARLKVDAQRIVAEPAVPQADELAFLNTPLPHERLAAAAASSLDLVRPARLNVDVEVLGPPPPSGSVSFDHVCAVKGLGFVEGVALIQAAGAALTDAGPNAGVPELHGLFLTPRGDVVLHGAPTGEPPARELARMLHQLVAPDLMPGAGRLFVGRWINNDLGELSEFASELAYFARPNSQELLVGLHARCNGASHQPVAAAVVRRRPERPRHQAKEDPRPEVPTTLSAFLLLWLRQHKPEVTAAIAVVASATLAALGTWLWVWQSSTVAAARPPIEVTQRAQEDVNVAPPITANTKPSIRATTTNSAKPATGSRPAASSARSAAPGTRATVPPAARGNLSPGAPSGPAPVQPQNVSGGAPPPTPPVLTSNPIPDLRIYTPADGNVEPPRLLSPEILEVLLQGFATRENVIELVVSEKGEVQQARMVGAPQRIPDVMLLSRAKELHFAPAVRNGVPVRYRVRLSWRVTP